MEVSDTFEHDRYMENYVRVIQKKVRVYLRQEQERIKNKKHLGSDNGAVKNFVDNFNPTTNLGRMEEVDDEFGHSESESENNVVEVESDTERPKIER
jgi:hypothetical protein